MALAAAFDQALLLAKALKLLRIGTVSAEANANKLNSIRYERAQIWCGGIQPLFSLSEQEDSECALDPQALTQRERLRELLQRACSGLEVRGEIRLESC